jgi:ribosome-associated protein
MLRVTDSIALDDHEIEERFVRGLGPGGQNARREETAVELRLNIGGSSLPAGVKVRLRLLAKTAVTTDGVLVIVGRASRSQAENRRAACARLIALLRRAAIPARKRHLTTPPRAIREERLATKKRRGVLKASRNSLRED